MTTYHTYQKCIDACLRCAALCHHCANSCAQEENVKMMARCIQLSMDCATVCIAAAQLMSLGSDEIKEMCKICARICEACEAECRKHDNIHCAECAAACDDCAEECMSMLQESTKLVVEEK